MRNSNIIIIMPAYNEGGIIEKTVSSIRAAVPYDLLVISDGSRDDTAQKARNAGAIVIEHPFNLGYGAALQTGFKYAISMGYEYAVQMDADGQHDSGSIASLLEPVVEGKTDIAIGSRFMNGGYRAPFMRKVGMVLFAFITTLITRKRITDSTSGFQALNRKIMSFYASDSYPSDYPDADVIIMLHRKRFRFVEVPVVMHSASSKKSMHGGIIRPLFYIFKMMLSIFVTLLRKEEKV